MINMFYKILEVDTFAKWGWGGKHKETGMLLLEIMCDLISLAQNYTTFDLYTNMYI